MKKLVFLLWVAGTFTTIGCGSKAKKAADKICSCQAAKDFATLQNELSAETDETKKLDIMSKLMSKTEGVKTCVGELDAEVQKLSEEERKKFDQEFETAIQAKCPDIAKSVMSK